MAKKRKAVQTRDAQPSRPKPIFTSPFKELGKMVRVRREHQAEEPKPPRDIPPTAEESIDDAAMLSRALEGVRRLSGEGPARLPLEPVWQRAVVSENAEVLAQLSDLVSGRGPFDITETEEYVEGMRVGVDPRLVGRLRRGEFAVQAHLDLHGMVQALAKEELSNFILDSVRKGRRAVLVVHGRGLRSPGGHPILKHAVATWLSHGSLSGYVLAFTTARAADGGAGAIYVLLRRERRRGAFEVLNGAKRNA